MALNQQILHQLERLYADKEDVYQEEKDKLETLPEAFEQGTWTMEDLEWIIDWKMTSLPFGDKVLDDFHSNDDSYITTQIDKAINTSSPGEKLRHVIELNGVAERMGSAFLLFMNPERYTVLDWKAWGVLHKNGYLPEDIPDTPTVDDYLIYLGACWAIANEYDVSLRTLDMALWSLDDDAAAATN